VTTHSKLLYILLRVIVCIYTDRLLVHLHPALISMSNAGMGRGEGGDPANTRSTLRKP